jgi:CRISPR/Cas system CSM-associated protein Csm3 (group 7 of RAMP superfamily)
MDLLDFFDMTKKFERVMVPGSETQGRVRTESEELFHDPFKIMKPVKGQDYAREYRVQEEHEMVEVSIIWYS